VRRMYYSQSVDNCGMSAMCDIIMRDCGWCSSLDRSKMGNGLRKGLYRAILDFQYLQTCLLFGSEMEGDTAREGSLDG
jgi:hypothetical protein